MPQELTFEVSDLANEEWRVVTVTTTYTVVPGATIIKADASGGAFTITLPDAAGTNQNRMIVIKKIDSTSNAVTVDGDGSDTLDDITEKIITAQYVAIMLISDGTNWNII